MITAEQAYRNYLRCKNRSQVERFVHSVLEEVITEKHITSKSMHEKQSSFFLSTIFSKIFLTEEVNGFPVYTTWKLYLTELPAELYGKRNSEIVSDLKKLLTEEAENIFICKAFKALIKELVVVRGFNVNLDLEREIFTVSWDLSSAEDT